MEPTRRHVIQGLVGAGSLGLAGCSSSADSPSPSSGKGIAPGISSITIGDGSTAYTGAQPHQPHPTPLQPGATPPQFVVFSWDGAADAPAQQLTRFRKVAADTGASMTLFLSGIFLLPQSRRTEYHPPRHPAGASDIGYLNDTSIRRTIEGIGAAWGEGHEIGTHFNGHFCGRNGVGSWSSDDWRQEIAEAKKFVKGWRTYTGITDLPAFPFDYDKELVGSRTPCLEGRDALLPVAKELGWRYDSSGGRFQRWPLKDSFGLWDLSMQSIPFPGKKFEVLSMDYNFMVQQSGGSPKGNPAMRPAWRRQVVDAFTSAFDRSYAGNRAPLIIGNHFNQWNGGIYMDAVEEFMRAIAGRPEVHLVSMRQLCDWLDVQDPAVLTKLQDLAVGREPRSGWTAYLSAA